MQTAPKPWYTNLYRRHLTDMHIEDWDERFLSAFSPEAYAENLKRAHIQVPMIYLQSHAGHCYWPTESGHMHRAFRGREDMMRRLFDLCRGAGMHPVGYYSLIYNTYEEDRHPDWRIVDESGISRREQGGRYGLLCPNNPAYRDFVKAQIDEIAAYFSPDGMFYDMLFWPEYCHCPHCRALYTAATGREDYPARDWADPAYRAWIALRDRQMGEFARFVTDYTKAKMPGVSVEHNYANAVAADSADIGSTELVNDACDYTGGDLYGDLYDHSFTAKYYRRVTKNPPFEYMTVRCDKKLSAHTVIKTEAALSLEVLLTAAHHGASLVIDAVDPVGTMDARAYDRIGRDVLATMHHAEAIAAGVYSAETLGTSMAFLTLSMCEIFHAFNMRSLRGSIFTLKTQNLWLWGAGILSLLLTTAVVENNRKIKRGCRFCNSPFLDNGRGRRYKSGWNL